MIQDIAELSASLRYVSNWADILEGLRRQAEETDAQLLPMASAGPLSEIRRVVGEAREFVESLTAESATDYHLPVQSQRQKVA